MCTHAEAGVIPSIVGTKVYGGFSVEAQQQDKAWHGSHRVNGLIHSLHSTPSRHYANHPQHLGRRVSGVIFVGDSLKKCWVIYTNKLQNAAYISSSLSIESTAFGFTGHKICEYYSILCPRYPWHCISFYEVTDVKEYSLGCSAVYEKQGAYVGGIQYCLRIGCQCMQFRPSELPVWWFMRYH